MKKNTISTSNKKKINEFISLSFIIFLLIIILSTYNIILEKTTSNNSKETILSSEELMDLTNTNADIIKLISKGGEILDGPRLTTKKDKDDFKSIFKNIKDPSYILFIQGSEKSLLVVMNNTQIIKTIPISKFPFN